MHLQQRMTDIHENPHLIVFYAQRDCKDCNGRGKRTHSVVNGFGQWVETDSLCPCVKKAIKKEAKELAQCDG